VGSRDESVSPGIWIESDQTPILQEGCLVAAVSALRDLVQSVGGLRAALGVCTAAASAEEALRELLTLQDDAEYGTTLITLKNAGPLIRRARIPSTWPRVRACGALTRPMREAFVTHHSVLSNSAADDASPLDARSTDGRRPSTPTCAQAIPIPAPSRHDA